jgi:hypothetical protein
MQNVVCLVTSLVFAAHALLGCGAHRTCEHRTAVLDEQVHSHAAHECAIHHGGHSDAPADDEHHSPEPCSHTVCSYVKVETQQADLSHDVRLAWIALAPVDASAVEAVGAAVGEPVCRADLSSTQLYVWHCALII